ncbi:pupal cuticle protein 27-like [Planococcus citri]|uniref:pupal cuticle protein 27-like n=1 Tax=Planococcus citri TaxID=170843 RepID=UPI0031F8F475
MMYSKTILIALAFGLVAGDRLDNVRQVPSAAIYSGGHASILSLPYQSSAESYKSSYKGPAGSYTTGAPLLHKAHYTPSSYASSNPTNPHHDVVPIVKQASEPNNGDGSYSYSFETANGISQSEYGVYKPGPTPEEGIQSSSGSYSYTGPDNVVYTITYTAGLEGFVPQGAHIPTPPPIPEAIQKVLQYGGENKYEAPSRYTSALPTPYSGYNSAYNKPVAAATYDSGEYKVQEENYRRK